MTKEDYKNKLLKHHLTSGLTQFCYNESGSLGYYYYSIYGPARIWTKNKPTRIKSIFTYFINKIEVTKQFYYSKLVKIIYNLDPIPEKEIWQLINH